MQDAAVLVLDHHLQYKPQRAIPYELPLNLFILKLEHRPKCLDYPQPACPETVTWLLEVKLLYEYRNAVYYEGFKVRR